MTPQLLDICCRLGEVLMTLARAFPKCEFHGYDISAKSLAAAQDRHATDQSSAACTLCKDIANATPC